jgi:hypothetical protein
MDRTVKIPTNDPDAPVKSVEICINEHAVDWLERAFGNMNQEYGDLYAKVVAYNRKGPGNSNEHKVMHPGLFPIPSSPFAGRTAYQVGLGKLYQELDAGQPPTPEELDALFRASEETAPVMDDIDAIAEQVGKELKFLRQRAAQIKIYAEPATFTGASSANGAFTVGTWAREATQPTALQLWQGQMDLWIQQDIIWAIQQTNAESTSVLTAPVKRLLSIEVVGLPVGITSRSDGGLVAPVEFDLNEKLPQDFGQSPTGRISNPLYDVRQARISLIMDTQRIPQLLNNLGRANFATPIVRQITAIDPVDSLENGGYVYGRGVDLAQVDLLVESLWLRRWTAGHTDVTAIEEYTLTNPKDIDFQSLPNDAAKVEYLKAKDFYDNGLMPDDVRFVLGLPPRNPNYNPDDYDAATGMRRPDYRGQEEQFNPNDR